MNILDQDILLDLFHRYYLIFAGGVFFLAFVLTWYFTPKVLLVSREKALVKEVNERSSHQQAIPPFGGVAFFLVLILVISILQALRNSPTGNHLIIGLTFLFMAGLKDDLIISSAKLKFVSQLFAAAFIIFSPELQLTSLHGFLGIAEIPMVLGYGLKVLIVVALINAYNLIDGIDGLAGIAGIVISLTYAAVFYATGHPYFVLISLTVAGILGAFLRFNFSRGRRKMFMGDGGSLVIGFMIAFLSLKILVMQPSESLMREGFVPENRLLFALAVLFIPIFDTLRVICIRLKNGKTPFEADRNHMHHVLLDNGLSHKKASFILGGLNLVIIIIYMMVSRDLKSIGMSLAMLGIFVVVAIAFAGLKRKSQQRTMVYGRPKGIKIVRQQKETVEN
ncbi:UDP-N-acetylmuramyl pentapeptide phosphotransferase/UDP-N-acetylglucosamine-1-phosphate transferase [Salegentibacter holothuriorum]|uniref:UDP-N-acetylmuramyl pentapeptide phosphotransferase/UDP-N-acetylglucosamine-1-phosphate transferase n=1 Tax=Salegentibacter holothuriorum TaxID=241145 RepID=A0A1T5DQT5_9FLAO|nr:MraY family glycosyltransferase [Salegentibacter holothuriorum]SKB74048.1 UDP-N-acetylmuramyl pentapeptide phosphotransferase/UDP-N-acetylglucosamine-1-phosphate transferase [Salegentibacter holothuriorum]